MFAKKWMRWLKLIVIIYALIGILIYTFQDYLIFQPVALPSNHTFTFTTPFTEANIPLDSSTNINIVQFKTNNKERVKGVILYFHGNKRNVERFAPFVPLYTKHNYEVWITDYPTYGKSTGNISEEVLYQTAMQAYKLAASKFAPQNIVIYGKSLGTGIAAQVASQVVCKQLILETPYYSLKELFTYYTPIFPKNICKYNLNTFRHLPNITVPITILHGTNDWIIPINHTRKLIPLLQTKDAFYTIEGAGHNYIFNYPKAVQVLDSVLSR
jgi:uncharacterized protein